MRRRTYRCYACNNETGAFGREFTVDFEDRTPLVKLPDGRQGEAVTCPNCGMQNTNPHLGANVVELRVLHFEPPLTKSMFGRAGRGTIACNPEVKVTNPDESKRVFATGEPLAVNCPACKETEEYKEQTGGGLHPAFDVPLPADEKGVPLVPEVHEYQKPEDKAKPPDEPPPAKKRA